MSRKIHAALYAIAFLLFGLTSEVMAQVKTFPLPDNTHATSITVSFPANVAQIDGAAISPGAHSVAPPSIYFKESGSRVYLTADASFVLDSAATPILNQVELSNFQTPDRHHHVDLIKGSDDGGVTVQPVAAGAKRAYFITWESMRLETQSQASPLITVGKVGSSADNPPALSARLRPNKSEFSVGSVGISARTLLNQFKNTPGSVRVFYEFDSDDPVPGSNIDNEISVRAIGLRGLNAAGAPDDLNPTTVIVGVAGDLPSRPENYSVSLKFPSAALRGFEEPGFKIPNDDEFVTAAMDIDVAVADLAPPSTDRAKTEFYFENTFTSVVNAKTRKRSNVGLFGLHVKPTLPILTHNIYNRTKSPWWMAFRPLFDADVDTQHIEDSEAPNRIVFGADFELGRDAGLNGADNLVEQFVWINGIHHDSDRDFKLQTLYWHTELVPHFRNWEQTQDQRLRQFRFPSGNPNSERKAKFPEISAYRFQPSIGYQLGGTVNRDNRVTGFPTNAVSRLFVKSSNSLEIKRLITLSLDDTYYFLENAGRRRNRNYLETGLDINTGSLFNVDLSTLQSAISLKFQRGELPPRFKPVNTFSIGFKLYR